MSAGIGACLAEEVRSFDPDVVDVHYAYPDGAAVARLRPRPYHPEVPGYVYGGLLASLIDCHATGSAAAAAYRAQSRGMDTDPPLRFLTAKLSVDFLAPTPLNAELEARGRIEKVQGRKVVVSVSVRAGDLECARGRVVCVQAPDDLLAQLAKSQ